MVGVCVRKDPVDPFGEIPGDAGWVVAVLVDVGQLVPLLHERLEVASLQAHGHVEEVHHLPVGLSSGYL